MHTKLIGVWFDGQADVQVPPLCRKGVDEVVIQLSHTDELLHVEQGDTHDLHSVESRYVPDGQVAYHFCVDANIYLNVPVVLHVRHSVVLVVEQVRHVASQAIQVVPPLGVNPVLQAASHVVPCKKGRPVSTAVYQLNHKSLSEVEHVLQGKLHSSSGTKPDVIVSIL